MQQPPDYQPPPQLLDSLSKMQHEAAVKIGKTGRGIVWWKVGEGKTRIALCWMFYVVHKPRPLIICSPGAFRQWQDEIDLLKIEKVVKPKFLSYGMLSRSGRHLEIDFEKFNCIVVDELWLYKNYKSGRSEMLQSFTHRAPCIGLSGSMVTARNIEDLYGQAKAIRLDQKVSPNITAFRRDYCIEITNIHTGFIERYPKRQAVEQIQSKLANNVHVYFPKETREIKDIPIHVEPTKAQNDIRKQLVRDYYYEHKSKKGFELEVKSAATLLVKLQQVSDGFLRDGKGYEIHFPSAKMFRLRDICSELIDAGERIIIWTAFRATVNLLHKLLPFPSVLLSSEHEFDHKAWANRKANVCIATVGSGASLNDFASVRYALLYSMRFSHIQVQQAKGRTNRKSYRIGCTYYYYLQTEGFPDRDVIEMVEESRATEEMVIMATNKIIAEVLQNET
jgi:hypothetical protein